MKLLLQVTFVLKDNQADALLLGNQPSVVAVVDTQSCGSDLGRLSL